MGEEPGELSFDTVVVERDPPALALVDTSARRLLRRIALPPFPCAAAVSADRRFAYVVHDGPDPEREVGPPGNLISVRDLQTGKGLGQTLSGLARPRDLAWDARGRLHLLVAEDPMALRSEMPNSGNYAAGQRLLPGDYRRLLPRGEGGEVYVLDAAHDRVLVQPLGDGALARLVVLPTVARPHCLALSPDGRWLVVGGCSVPEVTVVDAVRLIFYPALRLSAPPADLAFDAAGGLWAVGTDGRLWRGDARGLTPDVELPIRAFVRGRPAWGLTGDALVEVAGPGRVAGLNRPAMAAAG